jgi:hypothetical protein
MVSTSPSPNLPWPVSYRQYFVSMPLPAGPAKLPDQTFTHDKSWRLPEAEVGAQAAKAAAAVAHATPTASHIKRWPPMRMVLPSVFWNLVSIARQLPLSLCCSSPLAH